MSLLNHFQRHSSRFTSCVETGTSYAWWAACLRSPAFFGHIFLLWSSLRSRQDCYLAWAKFWQKNCEAVQRMWRRRFFGIFSRLRCSLLEAKPRGGRLHRQYSSTRKNDSTSCARYFEATFIWSPHYSCNRRTSRSEWKFGTRTWDEGMPLFLVSA